MDLVTHRTPLPATEGSGCAAVRIFPSRASLMLMFLHHSCSRFNIRHPDLFLFVAFRPLPFSFSSFLFLGFCGSYFDVCAICITCRIDIVSPLLARFSSFHAHISSFATFSKSRLTSVLGGESLKCDCGNSRGATLITLFVEFLSLFLVPPSSPPLPFLVVK